MPKSLGTNTVPGGHDTRGLFLERAMSLVVSVAYIGPSIYIFRVGTRVVLGSLMCI